MQDVLMKPVRIVKRIIGVSDDLRENTKYKNGKMPMPKYTSIPESEYMYHFCLGMIYRKKNGHPADSVLLMKQKHPSWQEGKFNGIQGEVKINETPISAIIRKTREETGIITTQNDWDFIETHVNDDSVIHSFACVLPDDRFIFKSKTDELIIVADPHNLPENLANEVHRLIGDSYPQ